MLCTWINLCYIFHVTNTADTILETGINHRSYTPMVCLLSTYDLNYSVDYSPHFNYGDIIWGDF